MQEASFLTGTRVQNKDVDSGGGGKKTTPMSNEWDCKARAVAFDSNLSYGACCYSLRRVGKFMPATNVYLHLLVTLCVTDVHQLLRKRLR